MALVYLQQQRENGYRLTYPTEMEKVWPIIFFKSVEREGCFPSYLKSCHVPLTTSTAVPFSVAYVMKCFWRKEWLFGNSVMSKKNEMRQIFCSLSFGMTVPGILQPYLLRHMKRILKSQGCGWLNVSGFCGCYWSHPKMHLLIFRIACISS